MKKILLFLMTILLFTGCNSDDNTPKPVNEIDKLPPPTQTGANIVGCLVDGKAFLPYGRVGYSGNIICNFIDNYFVLSISQWSNKYPKYQIVIDYPEIKWEEQRTYVLKESYNGLYSIYNKNNIIDYKTTEEYNGELTIKYLNRESGIISGTFWFDAINSKGEKVEIREGRFDMQYYGN